jgi:hypothetical protein
MATTQPVTTITMAEQRESYPQLLFIKQRWLMDGLPHILLGDTEGRKRYDSTITVATQEHTIKDMFCSNNLHYHMYQFSTLLFCQRHEATCGL